MSSKSEHSGGGSVEGGDSGSPRDALDRLRGMRVHQDRARGIGDDLLSQMGSMKQISGDDSKAIEAWETVVTDQINDLSLVLGIRRGKLVVNVPSASARFVVDRWLKSGGQGEFLALARVPIRGVELTIDASVFDVGDGGKRAR